MSLVPEPNRKVTVELISANGAPIDRVGFTQPVEPICMLVAQVRMLSGQSPSAFMVSSSEEMDFFTIESWDPAQRILTAKLKK